MTLLLAFLLTFSIPDGAIFHIAEVESNHNPSAVSSAGAVGMMQVMGHTARNPGFGIKPLRNRRDPKASKRFARKYIYALVLEFGSVADALRAYNWGIGNTKRWIRQGRPPLSIPTETKSYVRRLEEPVLQAFKTSWKSKIFRVEASLSTIKTKRDKTRTPSILYTRRFDFQAATQAFLMLRELKREAPLSDTHKRLLQNGITLTMPHGIKLSIDKDRVMNAPVPDSKRRRGGPKPSSEMSAFELGKREGKEAMQDGDFDTDLSTSSDMVQGIVENAGMEPNEQNLQRFLDGWMAANQESEESREARLIEEAAATPMSQSDSVFV